MKILVLNYEYPPIGGGAGNITKNISQSLAQKGEYVTVVTTWYKNLPEVEKPIENLEIIRLKSKRKHLYNSNPFEMLSWQNTALKFLNNHLINNKYDICLANFSLPGGYVAQKLKKKFNLPYCILSHGHDIPWFYKRQMFFYHLILFFIIKKICKNSSLNFIQTSFMKENIDKFLGKKLTYKNIIIPNGVEVFDKLNSNRQNEPFTVIFVGRFVQQKDPLTILKALLQLKKMDIPFKLLMVGDGPLRNKMEKFVEKNNLTTTTFTGWIKPDEVKKIYSKSHTIVTPSLAEGMSIANIEALAAGVYLVATPVSGNKEMLECCKNGVLVEEKNHIDIANKLQKFYFEQYLTKNFKAQNTSQQFSEQYSWGKISELYLNEFNKILKQ